jgi:hypothetical protein
MNNNLNGCGRKRLWPNLRYYSGICLERLKDHEKLEDSRSRGQDLHPGTHEYEAEMLTTRPRLSVMAVDKDTDVLIKMKL